MIIIFKIRKLIGDGKVDKAFDLLYANRENFSTSARDTIISLHSEYKEIQADEIDGIYRERERTKIKRRVLKFLTKQEKEIRQQEKRYNVFINVFISSSDMSFERERENLKNMLLEYRKLFVNSGSELEQGIKEFDLLLNNLIDSSHIIILLINTKKNQVYNHWKAEHFQRIKAKGKVLLAYIKSNENISAQGKSILNKLNNYNISYEFYKNYGDLKLKVLSEVSYNVGFIEEKIMTGSYLQSFDIEE